MKIAEALAERAEIAKKLRVLRARIAAAARFHEGEEPLEDAVTLLGEARAAIKREAALVSMINRTNMLTEVSPGVTITMALARRDMLAAEISILNDTADQAGPSMDPYSRGRRRTELVEKTNVPVTDLRREADALSRERRELDGQIQLLNWSTEIMS